MKTSRKQPHSASPDTATKTPARPRRRPSYWWDISNMPEQERSELAAGLEFESRRIYSTCVGAGFARPDRLAKTLDEADWREVSRLSEADRVAIAASLRSAANRILATCPSRGIPPAGPALHVLKKVVRSNIRNPIAPVPAAA